MLVAFEVEHHVDEVFEHPGAGDLPVLGDVPDQYRRDAALLRDRHQHGGHAAHLGHAAGHSVDPGRGDGLHRVEHEQSRLHGVEVAEDGTEVGLGGEVQPLVQRTDPFGPQPYLADRLLAAHDERR